MPNRSREKGNRAESLFVKKLKDIGLPSQRVPLSGAVGGEFSGDISIKVPGVGDRLGEVKVRAKGQGFQRVEEWLGANDFLFLKKDRGLPLVVMPWESFSEIVKRVVDAHAYEQAVGEVPVLEQRDPDPVPEPMERVEDETPLFDNLHDADYYNPGIYKAPGD